MINVVPVVLYGGFGTCLWPFKVKRIQVKSKAKLGSSSEITVQEMCKEMVTEDLQVVQRQALLKSSGFN